MKKHVLYRLTALLLAFALSAALVSPAAVAGAASAGSGMSVSIDASTDSIKVGEELRLTASEVSGAPTTGSNSFQWAWDVTSGTGAVTLSSTSTSSIVVTGMRVAEVKIRVTVTVTNRADDGSSTRTTVRSDECTINVVKTPVTSLEISGNDKPTMTAGESRPLVVRVSPDDATETRVTWESSEPDVAIVDNTGKVTALKEGEVEITATTVGLDENGDPLTVTFTITVQKRDVTEVKITPATLNLYTGGTSTLTAAVRPATASNKDVEWSSNDENVVTVDENGKVTAVAVGTATITATSEDDESIKGTCVITVTKPPVPVDSIKLSYQNADVPDTGIRLTVGDVSRDLSAQVFSTDPAVEPSEKSVVWVSSDPSVVDVIEVGSSGLNSVMTAYSRGTATITVMSRENHDVLATCKVTVDPRDGGNTGTADPDELKMETSLKLNKGESYTLGVSGSMVEGGASTYNIEWSSSDKDVATVDGNGLVRAVAVGPAEITATVTKNGVVKTVVCQVTVESNASISLTPRTLRFDHNTRPQTVGVVTTDDALTLTDFEYDENVIELDTSGTNPLEFVVKPVAAGETTLRVTASNGAQGDCTIVVSGVRLTDGSSDSNVDPEAAKTEGSVRIGKTLTLSYRSFGAAQGAGTAVWESTDNSVAYVSLGRVVGRSEGTADITVTIGDYTSQVCRVTVSETMEGVTEANAQSNVALPFTSLLTDLYQKCYAVTGSEEKGGTLSYITNLKVEPSEGVLYYGYGSAANTGSGVSASERYYYSNAPSGSREIKGLTFVPTAGFSGTANITFTGWTTDKESYAGVIRLTVADMNDVSYDTRQDEPVTFQGGDFNAVCRARTGRELSYVTFTLPQEARGTLYYDYSSQSLYPQKATASTQYARTRSPYLEKVTFVPAEGYHGTVSIAYRAVDTAGTAYTGTVTIRVTGESDAEDGVVTYKLESGSQVSFHTSDFNRLCLAATEENLNYIQFTSLPLARQGGLYYNYRGSSSSRVSVGSRYYRTGQPGIDSISFVAASNMTGKAAMTYVGYSVNGKPFTGTVYVELEEPAGQPTIRYSAHSGKAVTFQAADFNTACVAATGNTLDYVRFQLPSSRQGLLCYLYDHVRGTYGNAVQTATDYHRSGGSSQVGNVSFLADPDHTGPVSISYTGYDTEGRSYNGTVYITVSAPAANEVDYAGTTANPVQINGYDLRSACGAAFSQGQELSYIQFSSLPDAIGGRLYSGYNGYGTGKAVSIGDKFYLSDSPSIDQLSFVPRGRFQGVAVIDYTAYSSGGEQVKGQINITISAAKTSQYFNDMGNFAWAASSVDYMYVNDVVKGTGGGRFGPGVNIQRCDFVVMLCRAFGFTSSKTTSFSDVPANSYYATAIAAAKDLNIVTGNNNRFMPTSALTRQDAMVMLYNALRAAGKTPEAGSSADLAPFSDRGDVSSYARDAVYSLVRLGAVNGDGQGRLRPRSAITRAEMAVVLHYIMTM